MPVVAEDKLLAVMEFIHVDEEQLLRSSNPEAEFFKEITLPRDLWPKSDYGWLRKIHIEEALKMFRLRMMRPNSPYRPKVAFWYSLSLVVWYNDYPNFKMDIKKFLITLEYADQFMGLIPADSKINKAWYIDIDNLYGCFNVKIDHWVAIDVNFNTSRINVYDSIPSHASDAEIFKACDPVRKMMPWFLNAMVSEEFRKKSVA